MKNPETKSFRDFLCLKFIVLPNDILRICFSVVANFDQKYNDTIYDTFKSTLKDGNLIYYVNNGEEMNVITIPEGTLQGCKDV